MRFCQGKRHPIAAQALANVKFRLIIEQRPHKKLERKDMAKKYLVTGGAGFIGSHIASALVERGESVSVLDNLSTGRRENLEHLGDKVTFYEGCLLDREMVEKALDGVEVVYHQAALASVPRSVKEPLETNAACVTGTVNLLDAARQSGVRRVVYAGSSSAYGDQPQYVEARNRPHESAFAVRGSQIGWRIVLQIVYGHLWPRNGCDSLLQCFWPTPRSQQRVLGSHTDLCHLDGQRRTAHDLRRWQAISRLYVHRQCRAGQSCGCRGTRRGRAIDQRRLWISNHVVAISRSNQPGARHQDRANF